MIAGFLSTIATNVIFGWLWRRAQELGSFAAVIAPIYAYLPQDQKDTINAILSGQGGGISISAALGLGWYVWTQVQSYRATTKPQVVVDNTRVAIKDLPTLTEEEVKRKVRKDTGKTPQIVTKEEALR